MRKINIVPYVIRLKDLDKNIYVKPGNVNDWGYDLLNVLQDYLNSQMPSIPFDPENPHKKTIKIEKWCLDDRTISGVLKSGDYGAPSEIIDVKNDKLSYLKKFNDAELTQYFFLIKVPLNTNTGIAILQRYGNLGCKDNLETDFSYYISKVLDLRYELTMKPLIPKDLVNKYLDGGRITKIRLIKYSLPKEACDVDLTGLPNEEKGETELILKASRNKTLPVLLINNIIQKIQTLFNNNNDDSSVGTLFEMEGFEPDNLKVEVRIGNNYRTIDLSDVNKLKYSLDVHNQVKIDEDTMLPDWSMLLSVATELLNDCESAIWSG